MSTALKQYIFLFSLLFILFVSVLFFVCVYAVFLIFHVEILYDDCVIEDA